MTPPRRSERSAAASQVDRDSDLGPPRRRPRADYSQAEVESLMKGVDRYGKAWTTILHHYRFHPQRTADDLKEKYARITKVLFDNADVVAICTLSDNYNANDFYYTAR